MAKIKNDPSTYVKRSTLGGRKVAARGQQTPLSSPKRERDFMSAHFDARTLYIDFRNTAEGKG